jgi:hypothetical protein
MVIDGDLAVQDLPARARADDVSFLLALFVDRTGKPCAKLVPAEAFQADGSGSRATPSARSGSSRARRSSTTTCPAGTG